MNIDLPLGFGMALAQNEAAMKQFESLSEADKRAVIQRTHSVTSKQEMRQLVASLCKHAHRFYCPRFRHFLPLRRGFSSTNATYACPSPASTPQGMIYRRTFSINHNENTTRRRPKALRRVVLHCDYTHALAALYFSSKFMIFSWGSMMLPMLV